MGFEDRDLHEDRHALSALKKRITAMMEGARVERKLLNSAHESLGSVWENEFVQTARALNHTLVGAIAAHGGFGSEKKKNGVPIIKKPTSGQD